jgi:signal transduction histidine kinase
MRRDNILRSTPFRLALSFGVLFLGAFFVTGLAAYEFMRWEISRWHDEAIRETFLTIAAAYDDDLGDFRDAVRTNAKATRHHSRVFLATAVDGSVLAGNISAASLPDGWSTAPAAALGLRGGRKYRLLAGPVKDYRLVVGQSDEDIEKLEDVALASFAWTSVVVILLALGTGSLIGIRAQRRFQAVSRTMDRVSHGELAARIPLLGKNDDIDLLSREINEALDRLATTVEGMRQVSNDIAHDLKTPLNRLRITIEEARRKQERGISVAEELDEAVLEADEINRTFEALLRIAQIESGARKARFAPVDLNEIVAALGEIYDSVAEDAGMSLDLALAEHIPAVAGDRELLVQMYSNLIENAIRHCPTGTRIRLATARLPDGIATSVEDNGPGIPPDERTKVLGRLYRLERSRTSPGTGLGLSLAKAVADLHGAAMRLEDAEPGLRVAVLFPAG